MERKGPGGTILRLLTLPVMVLTLDLFAFVINALLFEITNWRMDSLHIDNIGASLGGALVISVVRALSGLRPVVAIDALADDLSSRVKEVPEAQRGVEEAPSGCWQRRWRSSTVPPLAVVGLTLESGAPKEAVGAAYLFLTNMAAIVAAAIAVFALYGVFRSTGPTLVGEGGRVVRRRRATLVIAVFLGAIAVPLLVGAVIVARDASREADVADLADTWAEPVGWRIVDVTTSHADVVVRAQGPGEGPDPDELRQAMDANGMREVSLQVEMTPADVVELPGT